MGIESRPPGCQPWAALISSCIGEAEITDLSWEIIGMGEKLEEMNHPVSTSFRSPIPQHLIRDQPQGTETLMEQHKSSLLHASTTRKVFVLAVVYGVLLFSSSASWKKFLQLAFLSLHCPINMKKKSTLFCNGTVFHFALMGHVSRQRCTMHT